MVPKRHSFLFGAGLGASAGLVVVLAIVLLIANLPKLDWPEGGESDETHALVGKPAPEFQLDSLDGAPVRLEQHRDKDVVILDFWATWCGPCRAGLPIIARVAAKYRERGVVAYAIDQQETAEDVRKFLEDERLEIQVLLDRAGQVGELYHVEGIPQTVLIGRDGKVADVHVGFSSDLETRLSGELDALLNAKDDATVNH